MPDRDRSRGDELPPGAPPGGEPAASVEEALARAVRHGRGAAVELLAALRALLDAASLLAGGALGDGSPRLQPLADLIEDLGARLSGDSDPQGSALVAALAQALDEEIARWQKRAVSDSEARAVLRAFLGLRELLWELGVRNDAEPASPAPRRAPARRGAAPRVQRVRVEG